MKLTIVSILLAFSPLFDQTSLDCLPHLTVMKARLSKGGTAPARVQEQIDQALKN